MEDETKTNEPGLKNKQVRKRKKKKGRKMNKQKKKKSIQLTRKHCHMGIIQLTRSATNDGDGTFRCN